MKIRLLLLPLAALLVALASCEPATPIEEARSEYFASVEGRDTDCTGWLDWCIDEGYPQADCEERCGHGDNGPLQVFCTLRCTIVADF